MVSVTGIASPSLDARLVNRMGMSPRIKRIPIFGLGCVAGAAGIARAADYVRAFPHHVAALLSVELCSLTIQKEDVSMANLISSALFGDGAAAVVVTGADRGYPGAEILDTRSVFYPQTEHIMGWDISEKGFQIVLSPSLPLLIVDHLGHDLDDFLAAHGLARRDIGRWILHTGGPKILEATGIQKPDMRPLQCWVTQPGMGKPDCHSERCGVDPAGLREEGKPYLRRSPLRSAHTGLPAAAMLRDRSGEVSRGRSSPTG